MKFCFKSGIVIIYSTETSQYSNFITILQKNIFYAVLHFLMSRNAYTLFQSRPSFSDSVSAPASSLSPDFQTFLQMGVLPLKLKQCFIQVLLSTESQHLLIFRIIIVKFFKVFVEFLSSFSKFLSSFSKLLSSFSKLLSNFSKTHATFLKTMVNFLKKKLSIFSISNSNFLYKTLKAYVEISVCNISKHLIIQFFHRY